MSRKIDLHLEYPPDKPVAPIARSEGNAPLYDPRRWVERWALNLMANGFILYAPSYKYELQGSIMRSTRLRDGQFRIHKLMDEYDCEGRRLAVWPD